MAAYFTTEYTKFFIELEQNNTKTWFHDNKKRYETHVRKPMIALVSDLGAAMTKHDAEFDITPSKCLGRINRDIRFSKDKTPYNKHLFAHISKGPKENQKPGIAFRFSAYDAGIMGGYYNCSKEQLQFIRTKISNDLETFQRLIKSDQFTIKFSGIKGEAYKRIPKELVELHKKEPLVANKQFYYVAERSEEFITSPQLMEELLEYWLSAKALNDFLS